MEVGERRGERHVTALVVNRVHVDTAVDLSVDSLRLLGEELRSVREYSETSRSTFAAVDSIVCFTSASVREVSWLMNTSAVRAGPLMLA